jgi:hypothetical protein
LLEYETAITARSRDGLTVDQDVAAILPHQALDNTQKRGFSAAALPNQRDYLALLDTEINAAKNIDNYIFFATFPSDTKRLFYTPYC